MSSVRYLSGFPCTAGGLQKHGERVISWNNNVYVSIGNKFVYVYSMLKGCMTAVYAFPAEVCHIELVGKTRQLYVLCAQTGIYLLEWDEEDRLIKKASSTTSPGGVNTFYIEAEFCCLLDSSVSSFLACYEVLVTVSMHWNKWRIKLFKVRSIALEDIVTSPFREFELSIKSTHRLVEKREANSILPVLLCISNEEEKEVCCSSTLDSSLFTVLFGIDVSMLNSPVILCGFPDGQVSFFPLKAPDFSTKPKTQSKYLGSLSVLYHLEQPIVFIGATNTKAATNESGHLAVCDCIVFLGLGGLIVTLTVGDKTERPAYDFREYYVKTPVNCAVCCGPSLYYSTCSAIHCVTIPEPEKTPENRFLASVNYNISSVIAISLLSCLPDGVGEFLALSKSAKLMICKLTPRNDTTHRAGLSGAVAGQRIKDLLSQIGAVSERASHLKSAIEQKNVSLHKLNQVMAISRMLVSNKGSDLPITCTVKVSWTCILLQPSLVVSSTIQNKADLSLASGWTMCIQLSTLDSDVATSYSFSVKELEPGETMEFTFPLPRGNCEVLEFPIKVGFTLFYSLQGLLENSQFNQPSLFSDTRTGICLPMQDQTIDILQCLRLSSQAGKSLPFSSSWDPVKSFFKTHSGAARMVGQTINTSEASNQLSTCMVPLTACVQISSLLLECAFKNKKSDASLCSLLIHWLLSSELVGENVTEVNGVTPNGREFCLHVVEVSVCDLSRDATIPAIEVQIASRHLDALASLHLAVVSRLKALTEENRGDCNLYNVDLENMQKQFIVQESLLKEVKSLRDSLCVRKERRLEAPATEKLLRLYRELRVSPLLFI
ncbi:hypothetical protein GDO86_014081 [Hymenochirus boettgeri]|uniref:Uncharacterized protein n=1 Tax=Hymenochirus boettgeri TaxID=247094 RepID=A0A8T2JVV6_9PIPI|nr:hypothetical protein GDO86_014081 [Hymenochirus boettgeri]KAG8446487.1 hypothetical protein GDO86_014081 [Hymenochirus boettgeri]